MEEYIGRVNSARCHTFMAGIVSQQDDPTFGCGVYKNKEKEGIDNETESVVLEQLYLHRDGYIRSSGCRGNSKSVHRGRADCRVVHLEL